MNRWVAFVTIASSSTLLSVQALAGAVPPALLNKTITLTWNIRVSFRKAGGTVSTIDAPRERVVYVSDKGRLFVREKRTVGRGPLDHVEERAPGNSANYTGNASTIHFEGNQLVAITGQVDGANIMRATFDSAFSSCSMEWMSGKSGSGHRLWKGLDGANYEIVSASPGAMSCNIRAGNAFAN
jgi:hypothetical protein